ncbi:DNA-3-methyladenine glycosylase family protein [Sporosarcina saromensis]|uniref:DNA-3-methyladenine glycosylase family protein n=1 Tax=Sporosarcina saromensis TaxID=359365 RepID=UPI0037DA5E7A
MRSIDISINLSFRYDYDRALERLASDPVHSVNLGTREVRIPMEEGNIVRLVGTGTTESPSFILQNVQNEDQVEWVKRRFHFHQSLDQINTHFMQTDLEQLFIEHAGTPLVRNFSLYGTLMQNIIHQQLNLAFSHTLTMRFVQAFGSEQEGVWRYPKPEVVARLQVDDLRTLQFSARKAEYVIGLSQAIADGRLDLNKFETMEDEEVIRELVAYRGVGAWTAQNFLLFGLGRPNLFPIADVGLQNALKKVWNLTRKPTADEIAEHFPRWSPYLSYAALYLWRSIE